MTLAKSGQQKEQTKELASLAKNPILKLIDKHRINAIAYAPHSVSRKIQFLPEFSKDLDLNLPNIKFEKAFWGGIPVAQKSLSKLTDRIQNAKDTIFLHKPTTNYRKILLIDDAAGSGATLNEMGKKVKSCWSRKNYSLRDSRKLQRF